MGRKAISKGARFRIFKRDGFSCQYCGAHPTQTILHCDHIHPVSKGGSNNDDNLITACEACNLGKGYRLLSDIPISLAQKAKEVSEREAQIAGYEAVMRARRKRLDDDADVCAGEWMALYETNTISRADVRSIRRFVEFMGAVAVLDSMHAAHAKQPFNAYAGFKYFCGTCWGIIRQDGGV